MAAVSHTAAAVVSPRTASRRTKIRPPPIEHDRARLEDVAEAVLADEHEEGGAEPDERVGAQPGAALPELALEPDQAREAERQQQVGQLRRALAGRLAGRRAEHHAAYMPAGRGFYGVVVARIAAPSWLASGVGVYQR